MPVLQEDDGSESDHQRSGLREWSSPWGGGDPESSVCPFCLSPKWMLTERQALAAARANAEFYGIMVFALVNIVAFVRFGELAGCIARLRRQSQPFSCAPG